MKFLFVMIINFSIKLKSQFNLKVNEKSETYKIDKMKNSYKH